MAGSKRTIAETVRKAYLRQEVGDIEPNVLYPLRCAYCDFVGSVGIDLRPGQRSGWSQAVHLEWDHVWPESLGGDGTLGNVALACLPCNRAKKDKTLAQWLCAR